MAKRRVRIVILCEDSQHEVFVRRYLAEKGYDRRVFYVVAAPAGRGSAEYFVRKNYSKEVKQYRNRASYQKNGLVTVIDADSHTVDDRHRQLDDELMHNNISMRSDKEHIVLLIPKRNIDTWIHYLLHDDQLVDESIIYRRLQRERDCQPAVERLELLYRNAPPFPPNCPPSLKRACDELQRLP